MLKDLGDPKGGKGLLELALKPGTENRGEDSMIAGLRSNLAFVLMDLGDFTEAKALLEQALDFYIDDLGVDHPYVAVNRSNLATVLKSLGDLKGARREAHDARRVALLQPEGSRVREGVLKATAGILNDPEEEE